MEVVMKHVMQQEGAVFDYKRIYTAERVMKINNRTVIEVKDENDVSFFVDERGYEEIK